MVFGGPRQRRRQSAHGAEVGRDDEGLPLLLLSLLLLLLLLLQTWRGAAASLSLSLWPREARAGKCFFKSSIRIRIKSYESATLLCTVRNKLKKKIFNLKLRI